MTGPDTSTDPGVDLHALMDRALADLPTPTARLRDGAVRRGRPLRRRRRAAAFVAGAAVVTALAAVTLPILGGSGPEPGGVAVESDPPPAQPPPFVAHPGWWDMSVGAMHDRLAALLPPDVEITTYAQTNTEHAPGETDVLSGVFSGTLRDAADVGPGSIEIMLLELPRDPTALADVRAQHLTCDLDDWEFVELDGPVQCETSDVRAGLPRQRTITFTDQGVTYTEVRRWTDAGEVYAAVANSTDRKWGPPASAVHAPLTLAELIAVAQSPSWTRD